ncbi:hypothetical protein ACP70R_031477 [Stipagrostis hirtigluma subsp. patula]
MYVKFDVFVNESQGDGGTAAAQCAGSVALAPHMIRADETEGGGSPVKTVARFGICDLLDEIGADGDETIEVSLVPRCAGDMGLTPSCSAAAAITRSAPSSRQMQGRAGRQSTPRAPGRPWPPRTPAMGQALVRCWRTTLCRRRLPLWRPRSGRGERRRNQPGCCRVARGRGAMRGSSDQRVPPSRRENRGGGGA